MTRCTFSAEPEENCKSRDAPFEKAQNNCFLDSWDYQIIGMLRWRCQTKGSGPECVVRSVVAPSRKTRQRRHRQQRRCRRTEQTAAELVWWSTLLMTVLIATLTEIQMHFEE